MKTTRILNRETCMAEARKYKSRGEFSKCDSPAYNVARVNGWLDDYTWFVCRKRRNYWNYETCMEEARKYKTKTEFEKGSHGAFYAAKKMGGLPNIHGLLSNSDVTIGTTTPVWKRLRSIRPGQSSRMRVPRLILSQKEMAGLMIIHGLSDRSSGTMTRAKLNH